MTRFWIAACFMVTLLALAGNACALDDKDKDKKDDDDKEIKEAQKDVLDLTKDIAGGKATAKDVDEKAAKIKKKYEELNTVMHIFKPQAKGGIGFGPKDEPKGIEMKIINLGKRALSAAAAGKEKDELIKMGHINLAMAAITYKYAPAKPKGGKGAKDWKQHTDDMKKAAEDLIKAAKASKTADIKTAANNLNNSCNNCHADFRDNP